MRSRQSPCQGWAGRRPISYVPVTAPSVARWSETPTRRVRRGPRAGASGLPRRCGSLAPLFSGFGDAAPCRSRAAGPERRAFLFSFCVAESRAGHASKAPSLRAVRLRASETGPAPGALRDGRIQSCRAPAPLPRKETQQAPFPRRAGSLQLARNADSFLRARAPCWGEERRRARPQRGPTRGSRPPQLRDRTCPAPVNPELRGCLRCLKEG